MLLRISQLSCLIVWLSSLVCISSDSKKGHLTLFHCKPCFPGWGVKRACNATHQTVCQPCPKGTYSYHFLHHRSCTACSKCGSGLYTELACTRTRDVKCDSCDTIKGRFNEDFIDRCVTAKRFGNEKSGSLLETTDNLVLRDADDFWLPLGPGPAVITPELKKQIMESQPRAMALNGPRLRAVPLDISVKETTTVNPSGTGTFGESDEIFPSFSHWDGTKKPSLPDLFDESSSGSVEAKEEALDDLADMESDILDAAFDSTGPPLTGNPGEDDSFKDSPWSDTDRVFLPDDFPEDYFKEYELPDDYTFGDNGFILVKKEQDQHHQFREFDGEDIKPHEFIPMKPSSNKYPSDVAKAMRDHYRRFYVMCGLALAAFLASLIFVIVVVRRCLTKPDWNSRYQRMQLLLTDADNSVIAKCAEKLSKDPEGRDPLISGSSHSQVQVHENPLRRFLDLSGSEESLP